MDLTTPPTSFFIPWHLHPVFTPHIHHKGSRSRQTSLTHIAVTLVHRKVISLMRSDYSPWSAVQLTLASNIIRRYALDLITSGTQHTGNCSLIYMRNMLPRCSSCRFISEPLRDMRASFARKHLLQESIMACVMLCRHGKLKIPLLKANCRAKQGI